MTQPDSDDALFDRLRDLAERSPEAVARMSMGQIARKLGMTRMTLYRRAGSRDAIVASLAEAGVTLRGEPPVRERVIEATADLLREQAIGDLTLDAVAGEARCSKHAIYDQFGSREGVLKAVFERYSPLASVEHHAAHQLSTDGPDLRRDAMALYTLLCDVVEPEWALLRAFVAEVLRDPASETGRLFRDWYAPLALDALLPVLIRHSERGSLRPIPLPLVVQEFLGPIMLHLATHERLVHQLGGNVPDRDTSVAHFTEMFFRAVGADGAPAPEPTTPDAVVSAPGR